MCFECYNSNYLYHGKKPHYIFSLIDEYRQKNILKYYFKGISLFCAQNDSNIIQILLFILMEKKSVFQKIFLKII